MPASNFLDPLFIELLGRLDATWWPWAFRDAIGSDGHRATWQAQQEYRALGMRFSAGSTRGRTTVRARLQGLADRGLITIRQQQGVGALFVRMVDRAEDALRGHCCRGGLHAAGVLVEAVRRCLSSGKGYEGRWLRSQTVTGEWYTDPRCRDDAQSNSNLAEIALPALARGWLEVARSPDGAVWYGLGAEEPEEYPAPGVAIDLEARRTYLVASAEAEVRLQAADPADLREISIGPLLPVGCGDGWEGAHG